MPWQFPKTVYLVPDKQKSYRRQGEAVDTSQLDSALRRSDVRPFFDCLIFKAEKNLRPGFSTSWVPRGEKKNNFGKNWVLVRDLFKFFFHSLIFFISIFSGLGGALKRYFVLLLREGSFVSSQDSAILKRNYLAGQTHRQTDRRGASARLCQLSGPAAARGGRGRRKRARRARHGCRVC